MATTAAAAAVVLGLVSGAGGAFMKGKANEKMRKELEKVANIPGLDIDAVTREALDLEEQFLPQASRVAAGVGAADQRRLLDMEEMALPGASGARQKNLSEILKLFDDDAAWMTGLKRRGAALGVGSGLGGGALPQLGLLKMSDQEKTDRIDMGTGLLGKLLGGLRIANTPGVQAFLSPTPSEMVNIRGQERVNRQNLLATRAGMPGKTAAWADYLSNMGGLMTGAGMMGLGGGGGAAGGAMAGGGQTIGYNPSGFTPYSGTYYAPGSRPTYMGG